MMTRGPGEPRATTASEPAYALVKGGPSIHLVLREILNGKILEALDWDRYKRHQKLMIGSRRPPMPGIFVRSCVIWALMPG